MTEHPVDKARLEAHAALDEAWKSDTPPPLGWDLDGCDVTFWVNVLVKRCDELAEYCSRLERRVTELEGKE